MTASQGSLLLTHHNQRSTAATSTNPEMGTGGGGPGINAIIEARCEWKVIVLANLNPPASGQVRIAIADALKR